MTESVQTPRPRTAAPLRVDSTMMARRSSDMSPQRSSIQSSRAHTPSSSVPSTPIISTRPPSPGKKPLNPGDSSTFLTALAAQDRRVLELKEELQKAEMELTQLKKQWATHEATKKRDELRHLEQLQPLKTSVNGPADSREDGVAVAGRELDRRKMAPPSVKPSQRTVFSGSTHTRTLSLLSPKESTIDSRAPSSGSRIDKTRRETINDTAIHPIIPELGSSTDGLHEVDGFNRSPNKDVLFETGKQLVGDFRNGLWTFLEDLKQVTVGDEAAANDLRTRPTIPAGSTTKAQVRGRGTDPRKATVRKRESLDAQSRAKLQDVTIPISPHAANVSASKGTGSLAGLSASPAQNHEANVNTSSSDSDDDGWDDWDTMTTKGSTPRAKQINSASDHILSPMSEKSSPRTSLR